MGGDTRKSNEFFLVVVSAALRVPRGVNSVDIIVAFQRASELEHAVSPFSVLGDLVPAAGGQVGALGPPLVTAGHFIVIF